MACAYLLSVALLARWGRDEAILGGWERDGPSGWGRVSLVGCVL